MQTVHVDYWVFVNVKEGVKKHGNGQCTYVGPKTLRYI